TQRLIAEQIDGVRTVEQILARVSGLLPPEQREATSLEAFGRAFLQLLWNRDFISLGLSPAA
ncbi:MAG: hypothetical protein RL205_239, partial [Actinomycetota bacterium]